MSEAALNRLAATGVGKSLGLTLAGVGMSAWLGIAHLTPGLVGRLAEGLATTLTIVGGGLVLGLIYAAGLSFFLAQRRTVVRLPATAPVAIGRSLPPVCLLLLLYHLPAQLTLQLNAVWCSILAAALVEGAYLAVILDGLRRRISSYYRDAALVLGLPRPLWRRLILLPQLVRLALPHLVNFALFTVKASTLAWFIGVWDLTQAARVIATAQADPALAYALLFALYLVIAAGLASVGDVLESALNRRVPAAAWNFRDV